MGSDAAILLAFVIETLGSSEAALKAREIASRLDHGGRYTTGDVNSCLYSNSTLFEQLPGPVWTLSENGKQRFLTIQSSNGIGEVQLKSSDVPSLLVRDGDGWLPLPDWASFLIELGLACSSAECKGGYPVLAVTLPTEAYAATLVATGVVLARSRSRPKTTDPVAHFEVLAALPHGTPVTLRDGQRSLKGLLIGLQAIDHVAYLRIQLEARGGSGTFRLIPPDQSTRVQVLQGAAIGKLPAHNSGRPIAGRHELAAAILGTSGALEHASQDSNDCLLLGRIAATGAEALAEDFAAQGSEGSLQEILRLKRFVGVSEHHRSQILPPSSHPGEDSVIDGEGVVIYAEATAFLKMRHLWKAHRTVVVLDRTDGLAQQAADAVKEEYTRRLDMKRPFEPSHLPPGIELLAFWVRT